MSIGLSEIIVVFVVALLLFGPEQLPVLARSLGKVAADLRRTSDSLRREFYNSVYTPAQEVRRDISAEGRSLRALRAEVLSPPAGAAPVPSRPQTPAAGAPVNEEGPLAPPAPVEPEPS